MNSRTCPSRENAYYHTLRILINLLGQHIPVNPSSVHMELSEHAIVPVGMKEMDGLAVIVGETEGIALEVGADEGAVECVSVGDAVIVGASVGKPLGKPDGAMLIVGDIVIASLGGEVEVGASDTEGATLGVSS